MKKFLFILDFFLSMICLIPLAWAAVDPAFSISSPQKKILSLEPFFLQLKLANTSGQPIKLIPALKFEYNYLRVYVAYEKEDFKRYDYGPVVDAVAPSIALKPKEALTEEMILHYNARFQEFAFEKEGSYRIKASFWHALEGKHLESNQITVKVKAPKGDAKKSLELFKGIEQSQWLVLHQYHKEAAVKFEKLVQDFPQTPYAMYAAGALGKFYFRQARATMTAKENKNYDTALGYFTKIAAAPQCPPPAKEEALFYTARIYGIKKDFEKAKSYLGELRHQFPETKFKGQMEAMEKEMNM